MSLTGGQAAHFSNTKLIRARMKAVGNIKKITKAMKMVAASKMKGELARLEKGKNFGIRTLQTAFANETYLQKRIPEQNVKTTLLVPITSDKGLCGGSNSQVVREAKAILKKDKTGFEIVVIGEKGTSALKRQFPDILRESINELGVPYNYALAAAIANRVANRALEMDRILVLYNEFKSAISSNLRQLEIMPRKVFLKHFKYLTRHETEEPEKEFSGPFFFELYSSSLVYHALLHSAAVEQSARMSAMENASKNAGELYGKLELQYNKARQAKITAELCEIISGASAI
jgi:F-type H+-transporting ATPase subunit gamma